MDYRLLFRNDRIIINEAKHCVTAIRRQNYDMGIRIFRALLTQIQENIEIMINHSKDMNADGIQIDVSYMMQMLQDILKAQVEKDYILLADLLELTVVPFCIALQQNIIEISKDTSDGVRCFYPENWNHNLDYLMHHNPELRQSLLLAYENAKRLDEEVYAFESPKGTRYFLEETHTGDLTLKIERGGRTYYMHSNSDPTTEAELFADTYTQLESDAYYILGFGKYFHIGSVARRSLYAKRVHVYEPDIYILMINLFAENYVPQMQDWLCVHFDPQLQQLSKDISKNPKGFMIHAPSIANIEDRNLKASFEKFFIVESAGRNQESLLTINYQSNLKFLHHQKAVCQIHVVDEILSEMKGKDVFIIAAGPSLDKNIEQLRNRKQETYILATGTVFYKMMKLGIRPDAVIITDANDRVIWQIREHTTESVPMLLLSTANREFIKKYQGPKYLIFQEGFEPAEDEAKRCGYHLFQTGGSVSTTALDVAISANARRIIFLGLDLAFTDDLAHATDTSGLVASDKKDLIPVKGFYQDTVMADYKFIIYREWIEHRIKEIKEYPIDLINATEGGSYIKGMKHKSLKEIL